MTRSMTPRRPVATGPAIADTALRLLDLLDIDRGVRLLGVSASGLVEGGPEQLSLDDPAGGAWDDASRAVDDIRERYGPSSIGPARLARPGSKLQVTRRGQHAWGPDRTPQDSDLVDGGGSP
jgi:DNA polymerase-4